MSISYCYKTNDNPDNPVSKVLGIGVDVAVITQVDLDELRSCRDFVEHCRKAETVADAVRLIRDLEGSDAPVLDILGICS